MAHSYRGLNLWKTDHLEGQGIDGKTLQWMLKIQNGEAWTRPTQVRIQ